LVPRGSQPASRRTMPPPVSAVRKGYCARLDSSSPPRTVLTSLAIDSSMRCLRKM
jgi:hypothetical protein